MDEYIKREDAIRNVASVTTIYAEDSAMKSLCLNALLATPTADVVPKSEVERLQAEKDALIKNYAECMKDYASEIFAEIEEIFKKRIAFYTDMAKQSKFTEKHYAETMIKNCEIYLQEIAELKKKYTEETK